MKNTLPKPRKRRPANLNTFSFEFSTKQKEDGHFERIGLKMDFNGQKALIEGDTITPIGFSILIGSLADSILSLSRIATEQGIDPVKLITDAGKRLGLTLPEVKPKAKIIGISKPKIIDA